MYLFVSVITYISILIVCIYNFVSVITFIIILLF